MATKMGKLPILRNERVGWAICPSLVNKIGHQQKGKNPMTITTYLFGLWLVLCAIAMALPLKLQIKARTVLLCAAPVLLAMSLILQGWFPALMVLAAIMVMEPGPLRWLWSLARARIAAKSATA